MALWLGYVLIALAGMFFLGYWVRGRRDAGLKDIDAAPLVTPQYVPLPFPVPADRPAVPQFTVELIENGQTLTVPVNRRGYRIFYGGRAWDHCGTSPSNIWQYRPMQQDTPRQAELRAHMS